MEWKIEDAVIDKIYRNSDRKDGTPYMTKPRREGDKPKPFVKVDIYFEDKDLIDEVDFPDRVSMLDFDDVTAGWEKGTKITGKVVRKESDDGSMTFWNFELPRVNYSDEISNLKSRVTAIEGRILESDIGESDIDKSEVVEPEDLPF